MNWEEIENRCPKSYEKYAIWQNYLKITPPHKSFNLRDLYDFFDKQKLYISVYYSDSEFFEVSIFSNEGMIANWEYLSERNKDGEFNTRTEAEGQAFIKAFEILEDKL